MDTVDTVDTASTGVRPAADSARDRQSGKTSPIQRLSSSVADPSAPAYIAAVLLVEAGPLLDSSGQLRMAEIRARLALRLFRLPQLKRRACYPGFLQGRPVWVDDAGFAIERHISQRAVDAPGCEREVLVAAERILRDPLDRSRPPWEIWFLTGLADGRLAVLLKLHHAISDGLGAVAIMATLFDSTPDALDTPDTPDHPPAPWTPVPPPSWGALLADNLDSKVTALASALRALSHLRRLASIVSELRRVFAMSGQAPKTSFNLPMPVESTSLARVLHLDLEQVRTAAHASGGKVNDVVLDVAAGGLRALLIRRGEAMLGLRVIAMVLVTPRSAVEARALGNQAGFMLVPLPLDEPEDRTRLQRIAAASRRAKAEQRPAHFQALGTLGVISAKVAPTLMAHQRFMNLIATNVPGPPVPLFLLGARILDVIPLLSGLLGGNVAVCFCALSYAGQLNLTVIADATVVPDVEVLLRGMEHTWDELAEEALTTTAPS